MNDRVANFGEQVGTLLPRLRRFARALTRHPQDADDLVQLAVERALTRSTQWRPDSSLTNWMLAIVRNAWIDETRSRRRRDMTSFSSRRRCFRISLMGPNGGWRARVCATSSTWTTPFT